MIRDAADRYFGARPMRALACAALACALAAAGIADANTSRKADRVSAMKTDPKAARNAVRRPAATAPVVGRMSGPVVSVDGTGADQAGFVHYFVITGPDGQAINHVG